MFYFASASGQQTAQDWYNKGIALKALGKINDTRAVEPLILALKDNDNDIFIQQEASEALKKLGWHGDT
ncbi:MAG: HEAT repeat domain-containing protein [Methanotrichaceae archaeon]